MISVCEKARKYGWPESKTRAQDTQALAGTEQAAKHARSLAKYLARHPTQTMTAVMSAILVTGVHLRTKADDVPISEGVALSPSQSLRLSRLLSALADELHNKNLLARAGPMSHRNHLGPLWFDRAIEGRGRNTLPDRETCLAIYLSFLFRRLTPQGEIYWQRGEPIPKNGNPRWPIVAALVRDTMGARIDEQDLIEKARKRISKNPGLQIVGYEWGDAAPKK